MKQKFSHIPIFPDAYLRDTTHLTTEQHGAYFLLLMAAWDAPDCALPNDEKRLARLARVTLAKWRKIREEILELWTIEGGRIFQKRLRKEWEYVRKKSGKRKEAADARWRKEKASKCNASADANAMHLGGGGGVPYQGDELTGVSDRGAPFKIVGGGK